MIDKKDAKKNMEEQRFGKVVNRKLSNIIKIIGIFLAVVFLPL